MSLVSVQATALGEPVFRSATVDGHRWWARIRQFRASAYVEAWDEAGFDGEAVVQTADVHQLMRDPLGGGLELPAHTITLLLRVARTFGVHPIHASTADPIVDTHRWIAPARPAAGTRSWIPSGVAV